VADAQIINFLWIIRLRWGVTASLAAMILAAKYVLELPLPLPPLLLLVVLAAISNALCAAFGKARPAFARAAIPWLLIADVLALTGALHFSGGSENPFSFLYLIYIVLGAVALRPALTWVLVALSMLCYASLFFWHQPLHHGAHAGHLMKRHLEGMWVAMGVTSAFIVYFVQRLNRALAKREAELRDARERGARAEKLASLATLAAGAAHELATPLSTIAVAAGELKRQIPSNDEEAAADVALIRQQVKRCRAVLDQMSIEAGESGGEGFSRFSLKALLDELQESFGERSERLKVVLPNSDDEIHAPRRALSCAIEAVVDNALDASTGDVVLTVSLEDSRCEICVRDAGGGMSAQTAARATEPFFTTKEPGAGMGLGLFLARATMERVGGELQIDSTPGVGTEVRLCFRRDGAETREDR